MEPSIDEFFRAFESGSATSDVGALVAMYAPSFLMAGTAGSQIVRAEDMRQAIPKRKQLFESLGSSPTRLVALDPRRLDDRYTLVRTEWQWRFERRAPPVEFTLASSFLLERVGDRWQIAAYIPHSDIMAELRKRGLLPS